MICWFDEARARKLEEVGGKGANLAIMTQAGMPVPPGFCVSAGAYRQVIAGGGLWPRIQALLAERPDPDAERCAAEQIRRLIMAAPVPADLADALQAAWTTLTSGEGRVAVRSSATAEDLPEASFAGQQDTALGVAGGQPLLDAVRACWASLWTDRAIAYRERQGFDHAQVSLAVVVQRMIPADTAGVLFTANPLGGARDQMLVNAAYGLGESVVSGRVTPDSFVLGAEGIERTIGGKQTRLDMVEEGGTGQSEVAPEDRDRSCLSDEQLAALRELGDAVQGRYGAPQDIEWAFVGDALYLLQTRPITTLAPPAVQLSKGQRWALDDILEHFPDPPFPLDHAAVVDTYQQLIDAGATLGMRSPPADQIIVMDERELPAIVPAAPGLSASLLLLPWRLLQTLWHDPRSWSARYATGFDARIRALDAVRPEALDDDALADAITAATSVASEIGGLRFRLYITPMILRSVALKAWLRLAREDASPPDLLADLPYQTARINEAMETLAEVARRDPHVTRALTGCDAEDALATLEADHRGADFRRALRDFLDEFGARTMKVYLPFSNRSWAEEPASLLATLAAMLRSPSEATARTARVSREHAARVERVGRRLGPLGWFFRRTMARYRQGHVAREATLFDIERCFRAARRRVDEASQRLVRRGVLRDIEQVRYLQMGELLGLLRGDKPDGITLIERERVHPAASASWWGAAGSLPATTGDALVGQPGSPGAASGPVRVISGPADFAKLRPGDVLVCPFTDPTWTPLFSIACAVVADTGGPLSHAAIVAREFGIPSVLGTRLGTTTLVDGQTVTVDGGAGQVRSAKDLAPGLP